MRSSPENRQKDILSKGTSRSRQDANIAALYGWDENRREKARGKPRLSNYLEWKFELGINWPCNWKWISVSSNLSLALIAISFSALVRVTVENSDRKGIAPHRQALQNEVRREKSRERLSVKMQFRGALAASFSHRLCFRPSEEAGDTCTTYEITKKIFAMWGFWKGCFCEMGSWLKGNCLLRHRVLIGNMTRGYQQYWVKAVTWSVFYKFPKHFEPGGCFLLPGCTACWTLSFPTLWADSPPSCGLCVERTLSQSWPFS